MTAAFVTGMGILAFLFTRELPNQALLLNYQPELITQVRAADGTVLDEFAVKRRIYTPIEAIPPLVQQAFISAEDKNFFDHRGVDPRAVAIAFVDAVRSGGERLRGASTITQQLLKNMLLSDETVIDRKIKEFLLAPQVERLLGKDKVLELYLNEIFLGQNAYGVAAAAQTYFNKTLDALAPREAAVLAALPNAPSRLHPVLNRERLRARRDYVLKEMFENGFLSAEVYAAEASLPMRTVQGGDLPDYAASLPPRDYFTDEIRRQMVDAHGAATFFGGGLQLRATRDDAMQAIAARALRRGLERYDRSRGIWRPTGHSLDPSLLAHEATWRPALASIPLARDIDQTHPWVPAVVLALGNRDARVGIEGVDEIDNGHWIRASDVTWARRQNPDGSLGRRARRASDILRVGEVVHVRAVTSSTGRFLRWTLRQVPEVQGAFMAMEVETGRVIALQGGFSYQHSSFNRATQALRQPGSTFKPVVYAAALDSGYAPTSRVSDARITIETPEGFWRPRNYSGASHGPTTLRVGLERSRNQMTVRLAHRVGLEPIGELAERLGLYDQMTPHFANVLGAQETTLASLISAYATFANGGLRVRPTLVDEVRDRSGALLDLDPLPGPDQVLDPVTAYQVTSMMRGVVERGTASHAVSLPVPTAGKTGTTNDARDVWFVGFTSTLAAGCYMGFDTPRSLGPDAIGGGLCAPIFQEFMREAVRSYGGSAFAVPEGGHFIKANRHSGARLSRRAKGRDVVTEFLRD